MTAPSDGAVFSRSTTPRIDVAGAVHFVEPVATERKLYMVGEPPNAPARLLLDPGDEATRWLLYANVETEITWVTAGDAESGMPFSVDASRPVTGVFTMANELMETGVGLAAGAYIADFTLVGRSPTGEVTLGSASVTHVVTPAETEHEFPFSIQLPPSADRQDFEGFALTTRIHGAGPQMDVQHQWVVQAGRSYVVIPGFTASPGERRVEIAVDGGASGATGITLSPDLTSWSGSIFTPVLRGPHVITARAMQGSIPVAETSVRIEVTS